jgi:hypothetical protein
MKKVLMLLVGFGVILGSSPAWAADPAELTNFQYYNSGWISADDINYWESCGTNCDKYRAEFENCGDSPNDGVAFLADFDFVGGSSTFDWAEMYYDNNLLDVFDTHFYLWGTHRIISDNPIGGDGIDWTNDQRVIHIRFTYSSTQYHTYVYFRLIPCK